MVDYIHMPGVVTSDFKDILLIVGVSASLIEVLDNPRSKIQWNGWRQEVRDVRNFATSFTRFLADELRRLRGAMGSKS